MASVTGWRRIAGELKYAGRSKIPLAGGILLACFFRPMTQPPAPSAPSLLRPSVCLLPPLSHALSQHESSEKTIKRSSPLETTDHFCMVKTAQLRLKNMLYISCGHQSTENVVFPILHIGCNAFLYHLAS